ncbi:hypothetical protein DPSP01_006074 [Paraphaeosphaeria sporulosa]
MEYDGSTRRHPQIDLIYEGLDVSRGSTESPSARFTGEQVCFECNAENCYESLTTPLEITHVKHRSKMLDCMQAKMFGWNEKLPFRNMAKHKLHVPRLFLQYVTCIEEYSSRKLTNKQDSSNAIRGVFEHLT